LNYILPFRIVTVLSRLFHFDITFYEIRIMQYYCTKRTVPFP